MALNTRIHGKAGQIKMDAAGGSAYVVLADTKGWTLDMSTNRVDMTGFGDTNIRRVAGLPDFQGTISALWNAATSPAYFTAVLAGTPITLRLIPNTADPTVYFNGLANIDGSLKVDSGGGVMWDGKWDAAGNWTMLAV